MRRRARQSRRPSRLQTLWRPVRQLLRRPGRWLWVWLWVWLMGLIAVMLALLVWQAYQREQEAAERQLNRDVMDAATRLSENLTAQAERLAHLPLEGLPTWRWPAQAVPLLKEYKAWLRLDWLDAQGNWVAAASSPWHPNLLTPSVHELHATCRLAINYGGAAYAASRLLWQEAGLKQEVVRLCVARAGRFVALSYSVRGVLEHMLDARFMHHRVTLADEAGSPLAAVGPLPGGSDELLTASRTLNLNGHKLQLRMDMRMPQLDVFSNQLLHIVGGLALALLGVMTLLALDYLRRRNAERELSKALAMRKAMEDSLMTGLRAHDREGRLFYVNPAFCKMVGYRRDELLGESLPVRYWPPELVEEYSRRRKRWLSGLWRQPHEGTPVIYQRKDGSRFPAMVYNAQLRNERGVRIGWMSVVVDVSEQRRVEQIMRGNEERLQATARLSAAGEMASHLSHELNQPLAVIASYATGSLNLLNATGQSQAEAMDQVRMALERIADQATRAGQIINSVRQAVRRDTGKRLPVMPVDLVGAILPLVNMHASHRDVRVKVNVPASLPAVLCAQVQVEQVLLNLARNAVQAMAQTPRHARLLLISARLCEDNSKVRFSLADRGSGIAPEVAHKLYTPFFTTRDEGMGMGLALCRTIVEQHGGAISHAPQEGGGTVFSFTLPVAHARQSDSLIGPWRSSLPGDLRSMDDSSVPPDTRS